MAKPENTFIGSVSKFLPVESELHREKMANPYRGGTADMWYSGSGKGSKDLWIEYKFLAVPVRPDTVMDFMTGTKTNKPVISGLQDEWLRERYHEGRNVRVIIGCTDGGVIFADRLWEKPISAGDFRKLVMSRKQIAAWIVSFVQGVK